jgi:acetyl esterase
MLYPPLDVTPGIVWPPPRAEKPVLTPELAEIFTAAYIADPEKRYDPLASPACPRNIASIPALPPTLLISGELDMLREQSERYADALRGAGVDLSFWMAPGADHSFTLKGPRDVAIEAFDRIVAHLERTIALPQSRPSAS